MNQKQKLLVICGPTATGKTALGISLAKKYNGEIISADSRQVYIGMDIGTGKDLPKNSKLQTLKSKQILNSKFQIGYYSFDDIPIWGLDIVKPNQEFSAADFVEVASRVIDDIQKRNKLPIIVGGTGFYLRALIDGVSTLGIPPDWTLRRDLEKDSREKLFEILLKLDPEKAISLNSSDKLNPRRLIRAIEIALKMQKSPLHQGFAGQAKINNKDVLFIGLSTEYKFLYERVDKRIDEQIKHGAEKEIRKLLTQGYPWDLPAMSAMGYGIWKPYFEKKESKERMISIWKYSEHAYVRRQMTWFKKEKRVIWFDISKNNYLEKIESVVDRWYNNKHGR
jgi:tRNA dimethylallyltransferase